MFWPTMAQALSWPCPAHDDRDWDFAKKYGLSIKQVIKKPQGETILPYTGEGIVVNSEKFSWMNAIAF